MAWIAKRQTKSGVRYDLRYRVGDDVAREVFRRRVDVENRRKIVEADELRGVLVNPARSRITLADWWDQWWPTTANLRESTRERDEIYWSSRIEPRFGSVRLDRIHSEDLQAWIAELLADGLAPSTVHKAVQILAKPLRAAVRHGRLQSNPAEGLELPRVEREEMRFLTPSEVDDLAEVIDPRYRALIYVGAYGGLRLGEMLALRYERVDLAHARLDVATTLVEVRGKLTENAPKTRAGRRSVPIPRVAVEALEKHFAACPGSRTSHVFTGAEGGTVRARNWRRREWAAAVRAVGLEPLRPHDLRHTAVAFWIAAGASPNEVAARAGHRSVVTVLDRYGHLLPGSEDRVNAALDELAAPSARHEERATVTELRARGV